MGLRILVVDGFRRLKRPSSKTRTTNKYMSHVHDLSTEPNRSYLARLSESLNTSGHGVCHVCLSAQLSAQLGEVIQARIQQRSPSPRMLG